MKQLFIMIIGLYLICFSLSYGGTIIQVPLQGKAVVDYNYPNFLFVNLNNGRIGEERICWEYSGEVCVDTELHYYRSGYLFDLSNIPDEAEIIDAWIKISITNLTDEERIGDWTALIKPASGNNVTPQ